MNGSAVYLGNLINKFKNLPVQQRRNNSRFNIGIEWDFMNQYELIEIADDHNIPLCHLVRIILEDFLEMRLNYQEIRDKLDEKYGIY